ESFDFRVEYLELRSRIGSALLEFGTKDLEVDYHRVERVLDLVRDSRCDASKICKLLGKVPLRFELLKRLVVAHADQRANRLARILDILDRGQQLAGRRQAGKL